MPPCLPSVACRHLPVDWMIMRLKQYLAAVAAAITLSAGAVAVVAGPASAAVDSRCSVSAITPYRDVAGVRYGGSITCQDKQGRAISAIGQRQGTISWATLDTTSARASVSTGYLERTAVMPCSAGSNSTYRSQATGTSVNGGSSSVVGSGRTVSC